MAALSTWSTTAASNNSASPDGWPEGMNAAGVNDSARENMAAVRTWYENTEWRDFGTATWGTPTYASATTFTVTGDQTATFHVNRPIKCVDATDLYGYISAVAYTSSTTVTVTLISGSLSASLTAVELGPAATNQSTPPFSDDRPMVVGSADGTKRVIFDADTNITTATTRTIGIPDANTTMVGTDTTQTLTNKTLTAPVISTISNTGTLTLPTSTDTLVGRATTDTLTNKTLTSPVISTISNTGTLTLPTSTDTLVGRGTTDTLTNKTMVLTSNTVTSGNKTIDAGYITAETTSTASGTNALDSIDTGSTRSCSAFGYNALTANTTGASNNAFGQNSLSSVTTTNSNNAFGAYALNACTGSNNSAFGGSALTATTSGGNNDAFGVNALSSNTTASSSAAFGYLSLLSSTGGTNSGFGNQAGSNITTGSNDTCVGYLSQASSATVSNEITLGNSSIATLRCQVTSITALSDERDKDNITDLPIGLDFINALRAVEFDWNMRDGGKVGIHDTGFIAQDLKQAQEDTGFTIPGLVYEENPEKLEAAYGKLIPVMVKAIQELSEEVKMLRGLLNA